MLPENGRPVLAGIHLPSGRRWAPDTFGEPQADAAWCTDAGFDGAFDLAHRLAAAFPETGLWPCIWDYPEDPAYYFNGPVGPVEAIDARKAAGALAERWSKPPPRPGSVSPFGERFPGLAKPTVQGPGKFDPFGLLEVAQRRGARWFENALRPRLMLVPCRHPADAVAAMGFTCGTGYGGVEKQVLVSSVLRSWEQRFATVLVGFAPGLTLLAVGGPPATFDHALHVAAEQYALAPREDAGAPGALRRAARDLLDPNPYDAPTSRDVWGLTWGD